MSPYRSTYMLDYGSLDSSSKSIFRGGDDLTFKLGIHSLSPPAKQMY